jgi:O-antigen/teichoic acid export membrane protein
MSPLLLLQFMTSPLGGTLDVTERQDLHFYREIVRIALLLGAFGVARFYHFDSTEMIAVLSAAGSLGYAFYLFVSWYALQTEKSREARPA